MVAVLVSDQGVQEQIPHKHAHRVVDIRRTLPTEWRPYSRRAKYGTNPPQRMLTGAESLRLVIFRQNPGKQLITVD
jgi:hypothetical protein